MILREAFNRMIKDGNHSHASLANLMGFSSPGAIGNKTMRNNMKVSFLIEVCDLLGYEVVLRPTRGENKADRTMVLTKGE